MRRSFYQGLLISARRFRRPARLSISRSLHSLVAIVALQILANTSGLAAGIDSRAYSCAALHQLIGAQGFVFVAQPAFGDFVVSSAYYCTGGELVQPRSVPTTDNLECPVNYCVSRGDADRN